MKLPSLRPARADDAPAIHAACVETAATPGLLVSWPQEITLAGVQAEIAACMGDGGCFLVAQGEGGLLGHAYLSRMGLQAVHHVYRLTTIVHPGQTGRGIGRLLLQGLHAWAAQQPSCRKIELLVRAGNVPALRLYEAMGYVVEGCLRERVRDAAGHLHDDLAMAFFPVRA